MKNSRKTRREIEKVFGGVSEVTTLRRASLLILLNDIYNGVTGRAGCQKTGEFPILRAI